MAVIVVIFKKSHIFEKLRSCMTQNFRLCYMYKNNKLMAKGHFRVFSGKNKLIFLIIILHLLLIIFKHIL